MYHITWTDRPECSNTVLDYVTFKNGQEGFASWDLTGTVKSWYTDSSLTRAIGIKMEGASQCNAANAAVVTFRGYGSSTGPLFVVSYRNMNGVEPYYSYQSLGADAAGSMHISDYTGNITIMTPLVSFASAVNPFSLNLIYNSSYFTKNSVDNYTVARKPTTTLSRKR